MGEATYTPCGHEGDGTGFGMMRYRNFVQPICTCDRGDESIRQALAEFVTLIEEQHCGVD